MNDRNLLKMFQGILSSQSFELLTEFAVESEWVSLQQEEKEVLSQLFLIHGESFVARLSQNGSYDRAKEAFLSACRLTPNSAKAHFRLGSFLAASEKEADLMDAVESLKRSIALDDRFFDAHYALGCALLRLGSKMREDTLEENVLIQLADSSFAAAHALIAPDQQASIPAEFYWHWGLALFLMGRSSGEPCDFQKALIHYQKAYVAGFRRPEFLNDYANSYIEFSLLVDTLEYIYKAALLYEEAALYENKESPSSRDMAIRLFNAACCYVHLFERTLDQNYFLKGEDFFLRALLLDPVEGVWQKLGQLYFLSARAFLNEEHVKKAIDSFHKAVSLGVEHPVMLAYYAQSLLLLYEFDERSELLQDAMHLANQALSVEERVKTLSAEPFLALGLCFYEQGVYFDDKDCLDKALDTIQKALQNHSRGATLWYALGLIKTRLADYERHEENLKEANIAMLFASRSLLSQYSHFWNDWGIVLLTLADVTGDERLAEEACITFEVAIEISNCKEVDWMYNLGCGLDLLGVLRDDEELFEKAISLFAFIEIEDPTIYGALLQQATALLHLGEKLNFENHYVQADSLLRRYLTEENEDDLAWCELGLVCLRLYEFAKSREDEKLSLWYIQEANQSFNKALLLGNEQVYYHLACYHSLLGNFSEAMEWLWKAEEVKCLPPLVDLLEEERIAPLISTRPFMQFMRELLDSECLVDGMADDPDLRDIP